MNAALADIEEELKFCQMSVESESRLEFVVGVLQEVSSKLEDLMLGQKLSESEMELAKSLYQKARLLLHRAQAILSIRDKEQEKFLPKRV
ncbi:MAG: hypothetical protein LZ158_02100 [Thaumarchaeota archaeon]|jgi:hypothetical protein|nr:hypothetical protein [Candidatus Terraquivivens yellowstonensis]MCL7392690.1 hypothetical protein [Candidatus Terraquivivens yellowstonensis]MCL7395426.1 hypothetical protein [Candidatus Terraquivivens yellowstonensis]MCL7398320.1 hypothetical protein [Candidatus Terraquivivens yellowstonensis]MCL7400768.1 hypothetical protein [Candidatus Terraquivivens yellowstonensis]